MASSVSQEDLSEEFSMFGFELDNENIMFKCKLFLFLFYLNIRGFTVKTCGGVGQYGRSS